MYCLSAGFCLGVEKKIIGISQVWPIFKASIPGLYICNIDSWSEFNFGKKVKKKNWYCFARSFLAVAARGKVALIHVAAKVCLFSSLISMCLYNLIEGKFIWDPGISRRVLWKASVVHVGLRILKGHNISAWIVILKDWTPVSIRNPCEVATSIMIHWGNGPGNFAMQKKLSAMLYSVWSS